MLEGTMLRYVLPALFLIAAVAAVPSAAPGRAQEDVRAEAARIERRLDRIEARVLGEDAELRRMNQALGDELLAAMEAISPGAEDDARRLAALRARTDAENPAEPSAAEARRLEAKVEAVRSAALRQPRMRAMVEAFHLLLREKMIEADPEAGPLLERYADLHERAGVGDP
jgi:hypothetical protein